MGEDEGVFYYADLSAACWENEDDMKNYMIGHEALKTGATCITYEYPCEFQTYSNKYLTSSSMANTGLGVPVKLLHESLGHIITVELKTGQLYRGKLAEGTSILPFHSDRY